MTGLADLKFVFKCACDRASHPWSKAGTSTLITL